MLGQKCSENDGNEVASILNIHTTSFHEKYLGLPILEGRMKNEKFEPTKEKLLKKCSDWKNTCLELQKRHLLNQ